jgi:hypothetical protein
VLDRVAFLSLSVTSGRRTTYLDVKAFEPHVMDAIRGLGQGEEVTVEGELMTEELRDKSGPIKKADGKGYWVPALKVTKLVAGSSDSDAPAPTRQTPTFSDDDLPPF